MRKSPRTAAKGSPSIISLRMASIYQRAGTTHESRRRTPGMFSIGKTMPESMMSGMSISMAEITSAVTCRSEIVEMNSPSANARAR